MGAIINVWLRALSIHAMFIAVMYGLLSPHMEWMFGIPIKQITIIDKTEGNYMNAFRCEFQCNCQFDCFD